MINETLKRLMKLVQPKKQEEPMTYFGVPITGINANTSTVTATLYPTQYATLAAQNAGGTYPYQVPTGIGIGGAGGAVQATTVYGQTYNTYATYANQTNAAGYNSYVLPMMSGILVSITFTDASGATYAVTVDQAYMQILQDISRNLQMTYGNQQAQLLTAHTAHLKMLDGDFSEEEMTEAEGIIAELEGSHGSEAPHP